MDINTTTNQTATETKFCKHCGSKIPVDAVICTACGRQVEKIESSTTPQVIVNNSNVNTNANVNTNVNSTIPGRYGKRKSKWITLTLCLLLGFLGAHKFYEGKMGMGIVYLFTGGLFGIGVIIDILAILGKPNPYYV